MALNKFQRAEETRQNQTEVQKENKHFPGFYADDYLHQHRRVFTADQVLVRRVWSGRDPCVWIVGTWELFCYAAAHVSSCQLSWEGDGASSHRVYFQQEEEKDISAHYLPVFCKLKALLMLPSRL